jgi:hypothetical protein
MTKIYTFVNSSPYSKYRLNITANNGGGWTRLAELQLMDTSSFSDTNGAITTIGPYTSNVTGLIPDNNYHIRSYVTNLAGTAYGGDQTFSTGAADNPPNDPSSLGPNNFVTDSWTTSTAPSLTFNLRDRDLSDQVQYRFQLDTNSNFSSPLIDYTSALQAQGAASFTVGQAAGIGGTYLIGNFGQTLSDNSSYYWRVQAIDQEGATSAFVAANSGSIAFKEDSTAPNPGSITFNPYSTSIGVYTTGSSDSLSGVHNFTYTNLTTSESNGPTTSTLWSNSGLTPNTQYSYAITVTDYAGNSSTTSTSSKYTLAAVPTGLSATSSGMSTVNLSWSANGNPDGTEYYAENLSEDHNSGWVTSTSASITGLSCGVSYSFQVKAKNADGVETSYGSSVSPPASPCNYNPNTPSNLGGGYYTGGYWVNNNTPTLYFSLTDPDSSDTVKYNIQISTNSDFSNPLVDYTSGFMANNSYTSFTVGQAIGGGSYAVGSAGQTLPDNSVGYYWRVMAIDNHSASSSYAVANSGAVAFKLDTVPPSAGVLSLVNATGSTVTLSYSGSTDNASGLVNPYNFINTDNWDSSGNTSATGWTETLTVSGTYHYKVRVTDVAGNYTDVLLPDSVTVTVPSSPPPPPDPWNPPPNGPSGFMLLINQGDTITSARNVTLQLTGPSNAGIASMLISNHSDLSGGTIESYQTTKSWDLCAGLGGCANGIYTVYGQFYNSTGSSSPIVSDQIRLQIISTLIPGNLTLGSITNNSISATISGASDNSVGLAALPYIFYNSTAGTNSAATSSTAWSSSVLSPNTQYTFYAAVTNQNNDLVYTPSVSAYTLANVPNNLVTANQSATTLGISWSANNNPNGTEYKVENTTTGASSGWTTATSYTFNNLICENSYVFSVKARNSGGVETAFSSEVIGLTGSCTNTITASAGTNGSIDPSGAVLVNVGTDKTFTITPASGYKIDAVLVDGISVGAVASYTFSNVVANHTIEASFTVSRTGGGGGGGSNPPPTPPIVAFLQGSTDSKNWLTSLQNVGVGQKISLRAIVLAPAALLNYLTYQFSCGDGQDGGLTAQSNKTMYTALDLCSYSRNGVYDASVLVTANNQNTMRTIAITVYEKTPPELTHLACQNEACVRVAGAGSDQCAQDLDCAKVVVNPPGNGEPPITIIPPIFINPPRGGEKLPSGPGGEGIIPKIGDTAGDIIHTIDGLANTITKQIKKTIVAIRPSTEVAGGTSVVAVAPFILALEYSLGTQGIVFSNIQSFADIWFMLLGLFQGLLTSLGLRKRRRYWGTVYDSQTKQPIDPAIVELIDAASGEVLEQSITDLSGRFGFLDKQGKYYIRARKTNYVFPSKLVTGTNDSIFQNVYHGELIQTSKPDDLLVPNIPMDAVAFDWNQQEKQKIIKFHPNLELVIQTVLNVLFWSGFVFIVFNLVSRPTFLNILFASLYVLLIILRKFIPNRRLWGRVVGSGGDTSGLLLEISPKQIPQVIVARTMTNKGGKFFLKASKGDYILRIKRIEDANLTTVFESETHVGANGVVNGIINISK